MLAANADKGKRITAFAIRTGRTAGAVFPDVASTRAGFTSRVVYFSEAYRETVISPLQRD
jgi:hypothetical protein